MDGEGELSDLSDSDSPSYRRLKLKHMPQARETLERLRAKKKDMQRRLARVSERGAKNHWDATYAKMFIADLEAAITTMADALGRKPRRR